MTIRPLFVCSATRGFAAGTAAPVIGDVAGCELVFAGAAWAAGARSASRQTRGAMLTFIEGFSFAMKTATDGSTGALSTGPVGIVLAGGASSRMGRDKTRLALSGGTLPELAARRLAAVCAEVAVADGGRGLLPDLPT